jgi:hypothetical protein
MSVTISERTDEVLRAIDDVRRVWPQAGFVVGGGGLSLEREMRPQVYVCERVSEAVDAMVKLAGLN